MNVDWLRRIQMRHFVGEQKISFALHTQRVIARIGDLDSEHACGIGAGGRQNTAAGLGRVHRHPRAGNGIICLVDHAAADCNRRGCEAHRRKSKYDDCGQTHLSILYEFQLRMRSIRYNPASENSVFGAHAATSGPRYPTLPI